MYLINILITLKPRVLTRLLSIPLSARGAAQNVRTMEPPRVLSIQSHVVSGYVGNKSATFPLQVLGFEVDAINTVQFSNHTGYGLWKGQSLTEKDLDDLRDGLSQNGLDGCYTHVLTGYNRSKPFLLQVGKLISELLLKNPDCDPVMGDTDRGMYVPKELLEVYRDTIIPLANVITPNQFEVELLTGKQAQSIDAAWEAISVLHGLGPQIVVVSSFEIETDKSLYCLGSMKTENKSERVILSFPKLPGKFTGTGDLFSALLLAWMWQTKQNLKESMELTIATLQAILLRTTEGGAENTSPHKWELKLIQSKTDIEKPKVKVFANYV